jgi:hypothetical protein
MENGTIPSLRVVRQIDQFIFAQSLSNPPVPPGVYFQASRRISSSQITVDLRQNPGLPGGSRFQTLVSSSPASANLPSMLVLNSTVAPIQVSTSRIELPPQVFVPWDLIHRLVLGQYLDELPGNAALFTNSLQGMT